MLKDGQQAKNSGIPDKSGIFFWVQQNYSTAKGRRQTQLPEKASLLMDRSVAELRSPVGH
jgi:hypothetical protein